MYSNMKNHMRNIILHILQGRGGVGDQRVPLACVQSQLWPLTWVRVTCSLGLVWFWSPFCNESLENDMAFLPLVHLIRSLPVARSAHGATVYDDKLWIFAGYDGNARWEARLKPPSPPCDPRTNRYRGINCHVLLPLQVEWHVDHQPAGPRARLLGGGQSTSFIIYCSLKEQFRYFENWAPFLGYLGWNRVVDTHFDDWSCLGSLAQTCP